MPMKARFTQAQSKRVCKPIIEDEIKQDTSKFDEEIFIKGAEAAYEIIINAFAKGLEKL